MDLGQPVRSVVPSLDGPVLVALTRTSRPMSGLQVHRLARQGSADGVRKALARLVEQGVVLAEQHGRTRLYRLNREHLAAPAVEQLADLPGRLRARLAEVLAGWDVPARHVSLFGSAVTDGGGPSSDVDLLVVRERDVDPEDPVWRLQLERLAHGVLSWTGNHLQVVELGEAELGEASQRGGGLVRALLQESVGLHGPPLRSLVVAAAGAR